MNDNSQKLFNIKIFSVYSEIPRIPRFFLVKLLRDLAVRFPSPCLCVKNSPLREVSIHFYFKRRKDYKFS